MAVISYNIARVYQELGQIDKAEKYFTESYQVSRIIGDEAGVAYALKDIGDLSLHNGKIEVARSHFEEAELIFARFGEQLQSAQIKISLGIVYQKLGDNDISIKAYESAISFLEEKNSLLNLKNAYHSLSLTYYEIGEYKQAYQAQKILFNIPICI